MINKKIDKILGSRRFSNYWWAAVFFVGGAAFVLAGLSSYSHLNLLPSTTLSEITFIPQGATMLFYGTLALALSILLWLTIIWNVGGGYNEFNNEIGRITIFRSGFPGKNKSLKFQYRMQDIEAVKIHIKEGLNPKREIYLKTKDKREIPLTSVSQPLRLSELENKAAELAKFLGVVIEGIE